VDAAANEALVELLAEKLDCARGRVELIRGHKSRHKVVKLHGFAPEEALKKLLAGTAFVSVLRLTRTPKLSAVAGRTRQRSAPVLGRSNRLHSSHEHFPTACPSHLLRPGTAHTPPTQDIQLRSSGKCIPRRLFPP